MPKEFINIYPDLNVRTHPQSLVSRYATHRPVERGRISWKIRFPFSGIQTPVFAGRPNRGAASIMGNWGTLKITVGFRRGVLIPGSADPNASCRIQVQPSD